MCSKGFAYDYYDWEQFDDSMFVAGLRNCDMWALHNVGWAREFFLSGYVYGTEEWTK